MSNFSKNKKRILWLILIILLGCGLTACSKKTESKVVTIRYVNYEPLGSQRKLVEQIIAEFEKNHPGIKVKYECSIKPEKVLVEMAGGSAPDVFYWNGIVDLAEKKAIVNLMPRVKRNKVKLSEYFPFIINEFTYKDGLYALPLHLGSSVLVYNKNLFDQEKIDYPAEGWTWDDFLQAAKRLTKDVDGNGTTDIFGAYIPQNCYAWIWMNGGRFFDRDMRKCLINTPQTIEAIEFIANLPLKYKVSPMPAQITEQGHIQYFMTGRVAMTEIGAFSLPELSKIKGFQWDVAPLPSPQKGQKSVYFVPVGGLCMSAQSKYKDEAWEFMKFYCGDKGMRILGKVRNCVPAIRTIANSSTFCFSPPEHIRVYVDAIDRGIPLPRDKKFGEFLSQAFFPELDKVFLRKKTVKEAVKDMERAANKILSD